LSDHNKVTPSWLASPLRHGYRSMMKRLCSMFAMPVRTRLFRSAGLALMLACAASPVLASQASDWSVVNGAAIRLLPGDAKPGGDGLAGLEIRLDEGWKTYWRSPGDAGIPPTFDWSKSQNLGSITVLWPAPQRIDDEGGSSAVYKNDTILPLKLTAADPSKPIELRLALDYAICHDICVPAKGEASLTLVPSPTDEGEGADDIAAAARRVPVPLAFGAQAPLAIEQVHVDTSAKPAVLTIDTKSPVPATLFIEGPANWFLPMPAPAADADKANPQRFTLRLEGLPKNATLSGTSLRLTLSTGDRGIESLYRLP
jgi:DsbC/DsbD-like thiol-disulfide interchange protein